MNYRVIAHPGAEPITLEEARTHLRIEPYGSPEAHPDDAYVEALISTARQWCEEYLRRALATQTIEMVLDDFPADDIELPLLPVQSISQITYVDTAADAATVPGSDYSLDGYSAPNRIVLNYNATWPATLGTVNNVKVQFVAGYTNGESPDTYPFPYAIQAAMLLIVGHLYENRQEAMMVESYALPMGVFALLQPYRLGLGI